jgi:hypothetical protein
MSLDGKWLCVKSEDDNWGSSETYDSRKEAIDDGPAQYGLLPGDAFVIGMASLSSAPQIDGAYVIEQLTEQLVSECGEHGSEWPDATDAQCEELETVLNEALAAWVARHKLEPTWRYSVCEMTNDGWEAEFWRETQRRARKKHKCDSCLGSIRPGSIYFVHFSVFEDSPTTEKCCERCQADRKAFAQVPGHLLPMPSSFTESLDECIADDEATAAERRKWRGVLRNVERRGKRSSSNQIHSTGATQ